jgi:hypothetical protein
VDAAVTEGKDDARLPARSEARDGRAQMRIVVVPELGHLRVPFEGRLNDATLDSAAASVDDAHVTQAGGSRGLDVFVHDRRDVARGEGMEIQFVLDGNPQRLLGHGAVCWHAQLMLGALGGRRPIVRWRNIQP